jgi:hypothetical protein
MQHREAIQLQISRLQNRIRGAAVALKQKLASQTVAVVAIECSELRRTPPRRAQRARRTCRQPARPICLSGRGF